MNNPDPASNQSSFFGLGIAPGILEVLDRMKFVTPTPIQHKAIPLGIEGKDVMGIAQTGTGKTLAFGIPMVQRLLLSPHGRSVVLVPTRELALQVDETIRKIGQPFNIRTVILIGGMNMNTQVQVLRKPTTRILIATPGRLLDHIEHKTVNMSDMKMVVLDEADRMLDMGFAPQINRIVHYLPKERQTMFFSATMPQEIVRIATAYMKMPIRVEVAAPGTAPERITQELFIVKQDAKRTLLGKILHQYQGSVLVFSRTKISARKITLALKNLNFSVAEIHSDRSLGQRREALEGFKEGRYRVLVATDIAARGIDVKGIELVINYDLPEDSDNYVHRIGRTGRAGRPGHAISFATPDQASNVRDIERLTNIPLQVSTHPEVPAEQWEKPANFSRTFSPPGHRRRGGGLRGPMRRYR